MASNTAIFYDIENLLGIFNNRTNTSLHLDEIYRRVLEMDGVTGVSIQRAYADWAVPMCKNLRNSILQVGIEPIHIFNTNQNDKIKNAADICLIIDAVDIAASRPEIENFVIASGDGIFAFLTKKLHEHGKRVIGCGFDKISNVIFRNSCDAFIALEKTDESIVITSIKRGLKSTAKSAITKTIDALRAETPKTETPRAEVVEVIEKPTRRTAQKKNTSLPRTKYTDALLASSIDVPQDAGDASSVMNMVREMVDALFVEGTKDLPGLEISIFANYISHYLPGFKVRKVGFRGIGEFMRFMLTGSQYCTYSVADNVVLMAPRTIAEAANGKIVADVKGLLIVTPEGERYNSVFNVPMGTPFVYTVQKVEANKPKEVKSEAKPEVKPQEEKPKEAATKETKPKEVKPKAAKPKATAPKETKREVKPRTTRTQTKTKPLDAALLQAAPPAEAPAQAETPAPTVPAAEAGTFRGLVKSQFEALAATNKLSPKEAAQLATEDYSRKTFGVRAPILRELDPQRSLREQRLLDGKVKYWKEVFEFNGKQYLVFKEWVNIHKKRFIAWSAKFNLS